MLESEKVDFKTCKKCGKEKPASEFYLVKTPYGPWLHSRCRVCECKRTESWAKGNRSKRRVIGKRSYYKRKYGFDDESYDRMLSLQFGRCLICGIHHKETNQKRLYVDHCHKTNKVRGLLCQHCNSVIGMARERTIILERAIEYLKKWAVEQFEREAN